MKKFYDAPDIWVVSIDAKDIMNTSLTVGSHDDPEKTFSFSELV